MRSPLRQNVVQLTTYCTLMLLLTGCTAIKGMLKPMVCDCTTDVSTAQTCPPPEDESPSSVVLASAEVSASTEAASTAANGENTEQNTSPEKRTLKREEPERDPLELIEPVVEGGVVDLDDEKAWADIRSMFPVPESPGESSVVLRANFDAGEGRELALVEPGRRIRVFNQTEQIAEYKFSTTVAESGPESSPRGGTSAVTVVRDGTAQILTHWTERHDDGSVSYNVGLFKLVQIHLGTAFKAELAHKPANSKAFVNRGTYEFLRGNDHAFVRWIPASDEGDFDASEATVYKWNKWEGVYRIPKLPPTAPREEKLQTTYSTVETAPLAVK